MWFVFFETSNRVELIRSNADDIVVHTLLEQNSGTCTRVKLKGSILVLHVHATFLEIHALARVFKTFTMDWALLDTDVCVCISTIYRSFLKKLCIDEGDLQVSGCPESSCNYTRTAGVKHVVYPIVKSVHF